MKTNQTHRERPLLPNTELGEREITSGTQEHQHKNDDENSSSDGSSNCYTSGLSSDVSTTEEGDGETIPAIPTSNDFNDANASGATGSKVAISTPPITSNVPACQDTAKRSHGAHEVYKSIAAMAGNVLEWYDFAIFGYFGDVIGEVFFPPNQSKNAAIIESFAVFGGAFLMRPVGGVLLGHIGDVYGRKTALEMSIFLMAICTFIMGCLPSYRQAGYWAIVVLAITRLVQGVSAGGQLMSSTVYSCEQHPRSSWGFYGTHALVASNFGSFLGNLVGILMRKLMTRSDLVSWGWRIPFCSGLLVGFSGLYLHCYCEDEHVSKTSSRTDRGKTSKPPLHVALEPRNLRPLMAGTMVPMLHSAGYFLCFVWMATFMDRLVNPSVPNAFAVNATALLVTMVILLPYAGSLSDKYGRASTMTVGGMLTALLAFPMLYIIGMGNAWAALAAQVLLGISLALWSGPMCAWLVESFEPEARLTSASIGYNVAQAVLGGFSPAFATLLVDRVGTYTPGLYISVIAVLALIGLRCVAPPPPPSSSLSTMDDRSCKEDGTVAESLPLLATKTGTVFSDRNMSGCWEVVWKSCPLFHSLRKSFPSADYK